MLSATPSRRPGGRRPAARRQGGAFAVGPLRLAALAAALWAGAAAAQKACSASETPVPVQRVRIDSVLRGGAAVAVSWVGAGKGCVPKDFRRDPRPARRRRAVITIAKAPAAPDAPLGATLATGAAAMPSKSFTSAALPTAARGARLVAGVAPRGPGGKAGAVVWSAPFTLEKCAPSAAGAAPSGFNIASQGDQVLLWWRHPDGKSCAPWYQVSAFDASGPKPSSTPIATWSVQAAGPLAPEAALRFSPSELGAARRVAFTATPYNAAAAGGGGGAAGPAGASPAFQVIPPASRGGEWGACEGGGAPPAALPHLSFGKADGAAETPITFTLPHPDKNLKACVTGYEVQVLGANGAALDKFTAPAADPVAESTKFTYPATGPAAKAILSSQPLSFKVTTLSGAARGPTVSTRRLRAAGVEGGGLQTCRDAKPAGIQGLVVGFKAYMQTQDGETQEVPALGASWEVVDSEKAAVLPPCVTSYTAEVLDATTGAPLKGCDAKLAPPSQGLRIDAPLRNCPAAALLPPAAGGGAAAPRRVKVRVAALSSAAPVDAALTSGVVRVFPSPQDEGGEAFFGVCLEGGAPALPPALQWVKRDAEDPKSLLVAIERNGRETACVDSFLVEVLVGDTVASSLDAKAPAAAADWPLFAVVPGPPPGSAARVRVTPRAAAAAAAPPAPAAAAAPAPAAVTSPVFTMPAAGGTAPDFLVPQQTAAPAPAPAPPRPYASLGLQYAKAAAPAVGGWDARFGAAAAICKSLC
ncbi:MAG: hypothetical protein J3K34DRAFT_516900 [Monoraphidium minutum]|nr:MAG: hypothetical protein J3K34DRAFT_516900 [Monoraphidium minutum]